LFAALGRVYTQDEFEALCFDFGIELDDVTTEKAIIRKEKHLEEDVEADGDDEVIYKIEVAANRKRTLVAIGAHDLDTLQGPFSYEALPPQEINFIPLKQEQNFRADALMEFYRSDMKLKKFLHIIENSPVYPVIYDSNRTVLSLPPIINGAHSAITLKTRNVFIECTATDLTKANIVLNTMVAMFSEYCENKFGVEPVEVVSYDGSTAIYPDLSCYKMEVALSDIIGPIGISLDETQDVAIAYGYNNVPKSKPKSMTIGGRQPLNRFSDKIRADVARAGYMEVLTFVLTSHEENFDMLNRTDDGNKAVIIANPRTSEFEVVRSSLMSCLLKTLKHNIDHPRPIKIFEVGDVVSLDTSRDVGASNNRRLAALYCNSNSGFEEIMGLVDRIVKIVTHSPRIKFGQTYYVPSSEPEFFTKRQCKIVTSDGKQVGYLGIVHAEVLRKFGIPDPCTFVEIDIEALL
uniref:phenylalanine--tRNA ligase n=1 Tax=Aegilops tauschii subsp. strangulata TaxID=200361 RepID=A0A453K0K7_AEGTS